MSLPPRSLKPEDRWAELNFKDSMGLAGRVLGLNMAWLPVLEQRRMMAYRIFAAYRDNNASKFLDLDSAEDRHEHREYGDAGTIVDRLVAGLLSTETRLFIEAAENAPGEEPNLPPMPELAEDAGVVERRIYDVKLAAWERAVDAEIERWSDSIEEHERTRKIADWLDEWAELERLWLKLYEMESENAVPQGDGVVVMSWDDEKKRPAVTVYPPEAYMPDLESGDQRRFPTVVSLVSEVPDESGQSRWLDRIQYRLGPIEPARDPDGNVMVDADGRPVPWKGDRWVTNETGASWIVRDAPWGEVQNTTCYKTHLRWEIGAAVDWHQLDPAKATVVVPRQDLRHNFIPVVHTPNTPSTKHHFGRSSLARCAQILDDLGAHDRDMAAASALAATPMFGIENGTLPASAQVKAGAIWQIPAEAKLHPIQLEADIEDLIRYGDHLNDRLATSSGVTSAVQGRKSVESNASGLRVLLEYRPYEQNVNVLRLTRRDSYSLIGKMAQRIQQVNAPEVLPEGSTAPVSVAFGPIIPTDRTAIIEEVTKLIKEHLVSRQTAIEWLLAAGFGYDDAAAEVDRINAEDFDGAKLIGEATNDDALAAKHLGLELTAAPAPPELQPTGLL